jgi:hypothetical protein
MVMFEGEGLNVFALPLATMDAWSKLTPQRGPLGPPLSMTDIREAAYDPTRDQMVVTGGTELVGGGSTTDGRSVLNDAWALDWGGALTAVPEPTAEARGLALEPPWPNPASGGATSLVPARGTGTRARGDLRPRGPSRDRSHAQPHSVRGAQNVLRWDGRDASGRRVERGVYLVRVAAAGVQGVQRIVVVE